MGLSTWESNRKIQRVRSDEKRKVAWFFGKCKEIAAGRPSGIENHGSINQPRYIAAVTVYISHCFPKCSKHGTSAAHVLRLSSLPWWRLTANTWWLILLIHYSCLLRLGFVPGFFFSPLFVKKQLRRRWSWMLEMFERNPRVFLITPVNNIWRLEWRRTFTCRGWQSPSPQIKHTSRRWASWRRRVFSEHRFCAVIEVPSCALFWMVSALPCSFKNVFGVVAFGIFPHLRNNFMISDCHFHVTSEDFTR